jgi:hypothetical protein
MLWNKIKERRWQRLLQGRVYTVPLMVFQRRAREKTTYMTDGFSLLLCQLHPWFYSLCTDEIALGIPLLSEGAVGTGTDDLEATHSWVRTCSVFSLQNMLLFVRLPPASREIVHPHSPFVQTFITALDTLHWRICLSALSLLLNLHFSEKWLYVVCLTSLESDIVLGRRQVQN